MRGLGEILARYGQRVTLRDAAGERTAQAFIQPDISRGETVPGERTAMGWVDTRLWRYIGLEEVRTGDVIVWRETAYRVRGSRMFALGDTVHHWEASLEMEREAAE